VRRSPSSSSLWASASCGILGPHSSARRDVGAAAHKIGVGRRQVRVARCTCCRAARAASHLVIRVTTTSVSAVCPVSPDAASSWPRKRARRVVTRGTRDVGNVPWRIANLVECLGTSEPRGAAACDRGVVTRPGTTTGCRSADRGEDRAHRRTRLSCVSTLDTLRTIPAP